MRKEGLYLSGLSTINRTNQARLLILQQCPTK